MNLIMRTMESIERDVKFMKRNVRQFNNAKLPQHNIVHHLPKKFVDFQTCSSNDHNQDSGLRQIKQDFYAFCDMKTEGGSWTVIQTRYEGSVDFYRSWNDYKEGFGNLAGEFWLGLDKIHELTSNRLHELRIEMENFKGEKVVAKYAEFYISDESSGYALKMLGEYSGDAGDSLSYHAGMKFSTFE